MKITTIDEMRKLQARLCVRCGERADRHIHLFGSEVWLCPTLPTFVDPFDSPTKVDAVAGTAE